MVSEMMGIRSHFQNNRRLTQKERRYGMLSWGAGDVTMEDIEEVDGEERLELREDRIQMVRKKKSMEEEMF